VGKFYFIFYQCRNTNYRRHVNSYKDGIQAETTATAETPVKSTAARTLAIAAQETTRTSGEANNSRDARTCVTPFSMDVSNGREARKSREASNNRDLINTGT
jgi:hypothetical protein